jgi:hypothetical protein
MTTREASRRTTGGRAPLWVFRTFATGRRPLMERAGRLTRPSGGFTLTMSASDDVQSEILTLIAALPERARG